MTDDSEFIRYMPYEIYLNILEVIKNRNVITDHKTLTINEINQKTSQVSEIIINGTRGDNIASFIYLPKDFLISTGVISNILHNLRKKYSEDKSVSTKKIEIMFISENGLMKASGKDAHSLTIKIFANMVEKKNYVPTQQEIASIRERLYFEEYTYAPFSFNALENNSIPKHTVVSEEEFQKNHVGMYRDKLDLPHIHSDDTAIIWIGAKPGDIIRIDGYSNITGERVEWRLCVPSK